MTLLAEAGKCSVSGLNVFTDDGTGITEFFGDNARWKERASDPCVDHSAW